MKKTKQHFDTMMGNPLQAIDELAKEVTDMKKKYITHEEALEIKLLKIWRDL
ncbi:MAG: hypothetical protein NUV98_07300 [Candidatus Roizmanbacteria bacterium]|nr:hypothetical protein [Candidatus Roizmanbacteria bacterium]